MQTKIVGFPTKLSSNASERAFCWSIWEHLQWRWKVVSEILFVLTAFIWISTHKSHPTPDYRVNYSLLEKEILGALFWCTDLSLFWAEYTDLISKTRKKLIVCNKKAILYGVNSTSVRTSFNSHLRTKPTEKRTIIAKMIVTTSNFTPTHFETDLHAQNVRKESLDLSSLQWKGSLLKILVHHLFRNKYFTTHGKKCVRVKINFRRFSRISTATIAEIHFGTPTLLQGYVLEDRNL